MTASNYPSPVDKLLTLGEAHGSTSEWADYSAHGLGPEHTAELIRMATDEELGLAESDSLEVWAPIHAWRALGQLQAESAVEPLLGLLHRIDDDMNEWVGEDLPIVMGMIGPAAIPAVAKYLADSGHGTWARVAAAESLSEIGQRHPASRAECVAVLTRQLERYEENGETVNTDVIAALIELRAVESAPMIERAFSAGKVDISVSGDWEDVQIEMGLRKTRETPKPDYAAAMFGPELTATFKKLTSPIQLTERPHPPQRRKAKKQDKRRQQESRRKKNRKAK